MNDGFRVDEANNGNANAGDESDTLSDIDDIEVRFTYTFELYFCSWKFRPQLSVAY